MELFRRRSGGREMAPSKFSDPPPAPQTRTDGSKFFQKDSGLPQSAARKHVQALALSKPTSRAFGDKRLFREVSKVEATTARQPNARVRLSLHARRAMIA